MSLIYQDLACLSECREAAVPPGDTGVAGNNLKLNLVLGLYLFMENSDSDFETS